MFDEEVSISILGPLKISIGQEEYLLQGKKSRLIFVVLALFAGEEVGRDELIDELNLESMSSKSINALHANMTRLRRSLSKDDNPFGESIIQSVGSGYKLNVTKMAVDAHRFVSQVEAALELTQASPIEVSSMLEDALKLWRSDSLVDLDGGPLSADRLDELQQLRTAARTSLLDAWTTLGKHQHVIVHARRYISRDPFNERMRIRLITALKHQGRNAEAYESYYQAERFFNDELGVDPGKDLRAALLDSQESVARGYLQEATNMSIKA